MTSPRVPYHALLQAAIMLAVAFGVTAATPQPVASDDRAREPYWTTLPPEPTPTSCWASTFTDVVARAKKAVVAIQTVTDAPSAREDTDPLKQAPFDSRRLFPDVPKQKPTEGIGSGFIIRADGYIVTNQHVVERAKRITVRVEGLGTPLPAQLVGQDRHSDIALLKVVHSRPLPVLPVGSSDNLTIGAWVVAIGNPFGLSQVATKGIVSGLGRTVGDLLQADNPTFDFIQTDASIDRGNSGGPLLNLRGEVVGINTAINSRARGIGFAIPIDLAKMVLAQLFHTSTAQRSYLGITVDPINGELMQHYGLERIYGVVITQVKPHGPAEKAGLLSGDVILTFAGHEVSGPGDISWRSTYASVDQPVELVIWRKRRAQPVWVIPVPRPTPAPAPTTPSSARAQSQTQLGQLGLQVADRDEKTAEENEPAYGKRGVVVVACSPDAAAWGIMVGDIIIEINGHALNNSQDFSRLIGDMANGSMIRFYILRQNNPLFIALPKH